jgi:hypothetical protein
MTHITSRQAWGAQYGQGGNMPGTQHEVVIHTEAGNIQPVDAGLDREIAHMRVVEIFHVKARGWQGVAYSFLIERSGTIFEGRGWNHVGAHTETRNAVAYGVCFAGHGDKVPATEQQWASARWLIGEGIRLGKITPEPLITGHRQYSRKGKTCPGNLIWPHLGRLRGITGPEVLPPVEEEEDMTDEQWREIQEIGRMVRTDHHVLTQDGARLWAIEDKLNSLTARFDALGNVQPPEDTPPA